MPRLCTGCGLTTDDSGNLIANVSDDVFATEFPSCTAETTGQVYCDPATGKLIVAPEPMYREWTFVAEVPTNPAAGTGSLTEYGVTEQDVDGGVVQKDFQIAGGTITNPSCRPMYLFIEPGIQHALFSVDSGGPNANDFARGDIQIESYANISGAFVTTVTGGHQHWGGVARGVNANEREIYRFDTSGAFLDQNSPATGLPSFVLPPGASINITQTMRLIVIRYTTSGDGTVRLENWRGVVKVRGWAGA